MFPCIKRLLWLLLLMPTFGGYSFACGGVRPANRKWFLPDGSKYIAETKRIKFLANGLPKDIEATRIQYHAGRFIFRSPVAGSIGWWEIKEGILLAYHGRPFVFLTDIYFPSIDKHRRKSAEAGCLTEVAIYDDDSDGRFETVADRYDRNFNMTLRMPPWLKAIVPPSDIYISSAWPPLRRVPIFMPAIAPAETGKPPQ